MFPIPLYAGRATRTTVIVVDPDGRQRVVTFQPGLVGADRTEVLSGLSEGQRVVVNPGR